MKEEKSGIFEKLKSIIVENIKNIKDDRRQRSDLKYSFKDIILGAFSLFYGILHKTQNPIDTSTHKKIDNTLPFEISKTKKKSLKIAI